MGINSDRSYNNVYFTTVFIAHTLSNVNPKVCGYREMLQYFSSKNYYCYNCALNNNLTTEFRGGDVYTEATLNEDDRINIVKSINLMVLQSMADKASNPYYSHYKKNDALLDYAEDIAELRVADDIATYKAKMLELSNKKIHIEIRITSLDTFLKDVFKDGNTKAIELPYLKKTKVTFNEALALILKVDKDEFKDKKLQKYMEEWEDEGFVPASLLLKGVINQHINAPYARHDDSFHRYVNALYEMYMVKGLTPDKITDSLERCKKAFTGIQELNYTELSNLSEYLYDEVESFANSVTPLPTERDLADKAIKEKVEKSTQPDNEAAVKEFEAAYAYAGFSPIERN